MAELDSDSDINLISEQYYDKNKDKIDWAFEGETNASFGVIGSGLQSNFPPFPLILQIGGVKISGKFIISKEFNSSDILLGSSIIRKYDMSLISEGNGKYRLEIGGPDPISSVPIFTVKKMSEKLDVNKIKIGRAHV